MGKDQFNFERTQAGLQFVIPGTEKPKAAPRVKYPQDGDQLVIPGAENITQSALLARLQEKPITPRLGQKSLAGTPLFKTKGL
jgi:hypothetical protein